MKYDIVKDKIAFFIALFPALRKVFYNVLTCLILRQQYVFKLIEDLFPDRNVKLKMYDAGGGYLQYTDYLLSHYPNSDVFAVDIKDNYIEEYYSYIRGSEKENRFQHQCADLQDFTPDKEFDLIIAIDILEHIENDRAVLKNFFHVLKPSGKLVISTPSTFDEAAAFTEEHVRPGYDLDDLNQIQGLKNKYPDYPISELLTLERLRSNAKARIHNAERYLFTSKGVEQSSSSGVAEYHARLFKNNERIADLCCGNGIDLLNIAVGKRLVYAVDLSNTALLCSKYNCQINKLDNIVYQNIKAEDFQEDIQAVFIDPDRRPEDRRVIQADDISPNFSEVLNIIRRYKNLVIKLSPVFDYNNAEVPEKHTWEFISEDSVLKEILLCTGSFASPEINKKVVLLPQTFFIENHQSVEVTTIKKYIYDPNPAIIRSGLVQDLAFEVEASLINKHLSILTSDHKIDSDFLKGYEVIEYFHYSVKILKKYLKDKQIGKLIVKVRGFPERPNQVINKFKLKGPNSLIIYLIRMDTEFLCLILASR